jgi:hypothetical protein
MLGPGLTLAPKLLECMLEDWAWRNIAHDVRLSRCPRKVILASPLDSDGSPVESLAERSWVIDQHNPKKRDALSVSNERFSNTKKMSKIDGGPNKLLKTKEEISDKL